MHGDSSAAKWLHRLRSLGVALVIVTAVPLACAAAGSVSPPVPLPDNAEDVEYDAPEGHLEFECASSIKAVADFYRAAMTQQGWQPQSSVINNANMVVLNFIKGGKAISFTILQMGPRVNVQAEGSALLAAAADKAVSAAVEDLEADESAGLPVPKRHTSALGTKTPFRRAVEAAVQANLNSVLAFYRRELGKRDWKEQTKGSIIAADHAVVLFTSSEGPAVLKLAVKDGETDVDLTVKDPAAATKAGIMPKPGQAKVMFGNITGSEAVLVINKQTIRIGAGAGTKRPDGPMLDLPPGKYTYALKSGGTGDVEIGVDETWGLMVGPGGILPLQAY